MTCPYMEVHNQNLEVLIPSKLPPVNYIQQIFIWTINETVYLTINCCKVFVYLHNYQRHNNVLQENM